MDFRILDVKSRPIKNGDVIEMSAINLASGEVSFWAIQKNTTPLRAEMAAGSKFRLTGIGIKAPVFSRGMPAREMNVGETCTLLHHEGRLCFVLGDNFACPYLRLPLNTRFQCITA